MLLDNEKNELKAAIAKLAFRENHSELFTLASGKKSPYYFNLKQVLLHPRYLQLAADLLLEKIKQVYPVLPTAVGGLTMGADPLTYSVSLTAAQKGLRLLPLVVRKQTKDHGSKSTVEGVLSLLRADSSVVLFEDVVTTGMSALQAFDAFKSLGFLVQHCFAVLDRGEGGREALLEKKIELHSLFTIDDFRG